MSSRASSGMTAAQIRALVREEVAQAFADAIPDMVTTIREQVETMIGERLAAIPAAGGQGRAREFLYRDFSACSPPEFQGIVDPIVSMRWISDVEGVFLTSGCPDELRVRFASNLLRGPARDWWKTWTLDMTSAQVIAITWEDFITRFRTEYVPRVEVEKISRDFLSLEQSTETIPELNRKFTEMALFCPQYAANEEMKMTRYVDMLRTDIREFVSTTQYTTLAALMDAARRRELELETQARKRKTVQTVTPTVVSAKKPKTGNSYSSQKSSEHRPRGDESKGAVTCYKCGQQGHYSRECKIKIKICYQCGQPGHVRADCPNEKIEGGAPRGIAAVPLRAIDGRMGQLGTEETRGKIFQLTAEEAQATP